MTVPFLKLDHFVPESARVAHGFFGRRGGASIGVYESLNCGLATGDPYASENRARVAASLGGDPVMLQTVYQVHGADCVYVDAPIPMGDRPRADAMVTDVPGILLGVLTADCAPVLFYAPKADGSSIIGAAHAGWKGVLAGVLESTVMAMCERGAQLPSLRAGVGPCITRSSYEVSAGFETPFLERDPADEIFFSKSIKNEKMLFDLPGYIARRLAACGVRHVILSDIDTVANEAEYFSYRRATLSGAPDNGRQISVIRCFV